MSRSSVFSSSRRVASTRDTTAHTSCSASAIASSSRAYAISGSTIQNSVRWRRVFDFSARNVGPKQYTLPWAAAVASL